MFAGDSAVTVPQFMDLNPDFRCNILVRGRSTGTLRVFACASSLARFPAVAQFVDGSHDYEPVLIDLANFRQMANQTYGHVLIVDDFGCVEPYCRNVRTAFYRMVSELVVQERKIITTEEYTYLVGGGETPVVNGMAVGIYLDGFDKMKKPYDEWVPFSEAW